MTDHRWKESLEANGPVWMIIVAAGSGSRFGGPKLSALLDGRSVLDWSVAAAAVHAEGIVLVTRPNAPAPTVATDCPLALVTGGASRSDSVRAGLDAVPAGAGVIVVHDAARPLATASMFAAVIAAVRAGADGAITAVPVVDTVKRVRGADVVETLDRGELVAVQTPQAFRASALRAAHAGGSDATDDASLIERGGGRVVIVDGDVRNRKLTTMDDLMVLKQYARDGGSRS